MAGTGRAGVIDDRRFYNLLHLNHDDHRCAKLFFVIQMFVSYWSAVMPGYISLFPVPTWCRRMSLVAYVRLAGSIEDLSSGHLLFGLAELVFQLFPIRVWMHVESICFAYSVVELLSELCLVTKTRFGIPKDPNLS